MKRPFEFFDFKKLTLVKLKDYFTFALDNLIHRRLRSWLTLLGIFIGVMSVVALIGLGDGLKMAVSSQFGISSTEVISVQAGGLNYAGPPGSAVVNPLTTKDSEDIEKLSTVEYAIPRILEQGKLEFNDQVGFGYAIDVPDGNKRKFAYELMEVDTEWGRLLKDGDNKKAVLGYNFGVDSVGLGKEIMPGNTILLDDIKFEVVGIMEKKGSLIFDNIVLINHKDILELMDDPDRVDVIGVKIKDSKLMDKAKEDIEKVLRKNRNVDIGEEDFEVQTPQAALSTVNDVLTGVQIFIVMIATISIIVGAIGIVNTMTTSVMERRSQIGVMKAIGAMNSDVFFQFFFESGLMGLAGGFIGVVFGELIAYAGTKGINSFLGAETSFVINFTLIALTLFGSFLIGSIAGIIPALKAANENPVDALRG